MKALGHNIWHYALTIVFAGVLAIAPVLTPCFGQAASASKKAVSTSLQPQKLEFQVSMRDAGWMGWTEGGMVAGMMERSLKIDAVQARFSETPNSNATNGGVWYSIFAEGESAWQAWTRNGETAGKQNQTSIQAIAMRLYNMPGMGIEYRVHQTGGDWLAWTSNGESAGIIGQGKTLDAIEVRIQSSASLEASLVGETPPEVLKNMAQNVTQDASQITSATSKKKSSSTSQTPPTQANPATTDAPRVESFSMKEEPAPSASASKKTSSAQQPSNQTANNTTTSNQATSNQTTNNQQSSTSPQSNQTDWGSVANTAGQVAGQAMSGANRTNTQGMNANNGNQSGNTQGNFNQNQGNFNQNQGNFNQSANTQQWSQWTNQPMQRTQGVDQPVFVPIASRRVALMANNNRYISPINDPRSGAVFTATRTNITDSEIFDIAFLGEHRVALKTLNGRYLSVRPSGSGGSSLIAPTGELISTNEAFEMLSSPNGDRIAFRASNGQYLSVEEFGQYRMFAKDGMIGTWESFSVALPDGKPLLGETHPQQATWHTDQDPQGRVMMLDQQGRVVGAADRVLLLVANSPNTLSNQVSQGITAVTTAPTSAATASPAPTKAAVATVNPSTYLSPIEMDIVQELNFVRTKPGEYATLLEGYRRYYKGKKFSAPGQKAITTKEGVKALDEAILLLKMTRPMPTLTPLQALTKASRDHVDNVGPRGILGHVGTDKSNPNDRAARYGAGVVNESICYGRSTAREIVVRLLIDDGTADRGYRKNILNPAFTLVGTAFGLHKTMQTMCSQVFAATYQEK